jgi:site-specific DNA-methyltransferase (adenine-specific)
MRLLKGNNIDLLKTLDENSVDSIVTDPPYGLSFMNKKWDANVPSVDFWKEVYRVLKPGGHVLSFGGTRTYHRMAVAIEDAGFEIRDQIQWIYGSGFPKSLNLGNGWGTQLKPANEPVCLARKPIDQDTIKKNVEEWGTGGINIDDSRVGDEQVVAHHAPKGTFAGGEQDRGSHKTYYTNTGRFPTNVIFECICDEVLEGDTKKANTNYKWSNTECGGNTFTQRGKYTPRDDTKHHHTNPDCPCHILDSQSDNASRFFYQAKVSKKERNMGATNTHPTVKPIDLMKYLCRLITPKNGVVLDPFMGSGSTGIAAILEGFDFIGMEMDEKYFDISVARIDAYSKNNIHND